MSLQVVEDAHAFLRANLRGQLRYDERLSPLKFIIGPDGRLIAPVHHEVLESFDVVLFVPEYRDDVLELQLTPEPLGKQGADAELIDRWLIHYGEALEPAWGRFVIDTARYEGVVIDGEALTRPNPLAAAEAGLCRFVNQNRIDALRRIVAQATNVLVEHPAMVGIDPGGIDVRAAFGILRLTFQHHVADAESARHAIGRMLEQVGVAADEEAE
jgi:hypothetical protein